MDEQVIELDMKLIQLATELECNTAYIKYYASQVGDYASKERQRYEAINKVLHVQMRNVLEHLRLLGN